jgi:hypothetical protein
MTKDAKSTHDGGILGLKYMMLIGVVFKDNYSGPKNEMPRTTAIVNDKKYLFCLIPGLHHDDFSCLEKKIDENKSFAHL